MKSKARLSLLLMMAVSCGSDSKKDFAGVWLWTGNESVRGSQKYLEFLNDGTVYKGDADGRLTYCWKPDGTDTFSFYYKDPKQGEVPLEGNARIEGDLLSVTTSFGSSHSIKTVYRRATADEISHLSRSTRDTREALRESLAEQEASRCSNLVHGIRNMMSTYRSRFGGSENAYPPETGSAFWQTLYSCDPPLISKGEEWLLFCPFTGAKPEWGATNFRGPANDANTLDDDDVIGCCEPGGHPDGSISVLKKSGEVLRVRSMDPLYDQALKSTIGKP